MDDFQTTFIPKKPIGESALPKQPQQRNPSVGIFTMIATLLFILSIVASGGIYFYNKLLTSNIDAMRESLAAAEDRIEQGFIVELQDLDKRLRNANQIISQHIALSPFFRFLEDNTLKSIQYDSFDFSFQEGRPVATITGRSRQYRAIAEQSISFGESSLIETHVFSNFALTQQGQVSFNLKIVPSGDLYYFERSLGRVADTTFTTTSTPVNTINVQTIPTPQDSSDGIPEGGVNESTQDPLDPAGLIESDEQALLPVVNNIG